MLTTPTLWRYCSFERAHQRVAFVTKAMAGCCYLCWYFVLQQPDQPLHLSVESFNHCLVSRHLLGNISLGKSPLPFCHREQESLSVHNCICHMNLPNQLDMYAPHCVLWSGFKGCIHFHWCMLHCVWLNFLLGLILKGPCQDTSISREMLPSSCTIATFWLELLGKSVT